MKKINVPIQLITDSDYQQNNYIGGFSDFEKEVINKYSSNPILHLFCGNSNIGKERIDLNPKSEATQIIDVFKFLQDYKGSPKTILLDPVYSNEWRTEEWRKRYSQFGIKKEEIYIYPYDSRRTSKLFNHFNKIHPQRIIIKSLVICNIPNYKLKKIFISIIGAYKPNRILAIYENNQKELI